MIRSFGVARVMSVKVMHTFCPGFTISFNGLAPIGFSSAWITAARSSGSPALCRGAMTVVRSLGSSIVRWP